MLRYISIAPNAIGAAIKHFETQPVPNLATLKSAITKQTWSPCVWNGPRSKANFASADFCALDFDRGMTVAEAIAMVQKAELAAVIGATKSHQRPKDDAPPCDRFRLVMPWHATITDRATYEQNMDRVIKRTGADKCRDAGRLFFACTEILYAQEGKPLQWASFIPQDVAKFTRPTYHAQRSLPPRFLHWYQTVGSQNGNRNSATLWAAARLKEMGFTEGEAFGLLSPYCLFTRDFTEAEFQRTVRNAFRLEPRS